MNDDPQLAPLDTGSAAPGPTPVIVYLSGRRRGSSERLTDATVNIVREGAHGGVRVAPAAPDGDQDMPARLHRAGKGYELEVLPEHQVWVNAEPARTRMLTSGDVLEIGRNGPMLRYRVYTDGHVPPRGVADAFRDCVDSARFDRGHVVRRTGVLLGGMTAEFLIRTTLWFRLGVLAALVLLVASTLYLVVENRQLAERLARNEAQMLAISAILEQTQSEAIRHEDLANLRDTLESHLSTAVERVGALEERFGASARVIAMAGESVIFLQGTYGYRDADSGRPLRYVGLGPDGEPLRTPMGGPAVTLGGDGPVVEIEFTGTAFAVTADGLLLTNRHVALPWETDERAALDGLGLEPAVMRFLGYRPGVADSFEVMLVSASDDSDLALLRCGELARGLAPLVPGTRVPAPGEEVIVLGYPTGIRAMLARTDTAFLDSLREDQALDFWSVVAHLARAGHIRPIATRGIVGQLTPSAVVYDAETTHGGSGGPVITLRGEVIAVNAAILPEFGGSNMGVPIARARALLEGAGPGGS